MKVLYQLHPDSRKLQEKQNTTVEELYLPRHVLDSISTSLLDSTALLPSSARSFQDWAVGLLDRFEDRD
jgi:hypothetical protein